MDKRNRYFREEDIRKFLLDHYCVVSADGMQLLFADADIWRDMLDALPAHTREEIMNEI